MAKYELGPVTSLTEAVAYIVGPMFGISTIYGWRSQGSVPDSDHPKGKALDFMTPNQAVGDALSGFLIANHKILGVDYIVWNRRSWNSRRKTWEPYTSTNNPHTDHVHLSLLDKNDGTPLEDFSRGLLDGATGSLDALGQAVVDPWGIGKVVTNRDFWRRIATGVVGVGFIIAGLLFISRRPAIAVVSSVGGAAKDLAGTALQGWAFGLGAGTTGALGTAKVKPVSPAPAQVSSTPVTVPTQARLGPKPPKMLPPKQSPPNAPTTSVLPPEIYAPVSPGGTFTVTRAKGRVENPTEYRPPKGGSLLDLAGKRNPAPVSKKKKSKKGQFTPSVQAPMRQEPYGGQ